jgi:AraC-like DNA-binding protein
MQTDVMLQTPNPILLAGRVPFAPFEAAGAIFAETRWRQPKQTPGAAGSDITLSRWTAARGEQRTEFAATPDHCHVVALSLTATRMSLSTASKPLLEGIVPPGTIVVSTPGQQLRASVVPPFDFLHIHIDNRVLFDDGLAEGDDGIALADEPFRDTLAEALGRTLLDEPIHPDYANVVARTIVMRAMRRRPAPRRCWALPKWRMKRVEQYLADNIDRRIGLDDMATAAGLSKMHFAAQFRAATGFRPHEYLLFMRIERAKRVMVASEMPLVEVALSVGFNAQAHFSTVFKRFTGKSPAQWKQECRRAA